MRRTVILLATCALVIVGHRTVRAADEGRALVLGFELTVSVSDDQTHVVFVPRAENSSASPLAVCGFFECSALFRTEDQRDRWPAFTVLDANRRGGKGLRVSDVVTLEPGEAMTGNLAFSYDHSYFAGYPGNIEVRGKFVHGAPGDTWNKAHRSARIVRVLLPVP